MLTKGFRWSAVPAALVTRVRVADTAGLLWATVGKCQYLGHIRRVHGGVGPQPPQPASPGTGTYLLA